jgi:hypothetical protein
LFPGEKSGMDMTNPVAGLGCVKELLKNLAKY